jgi:hypothetical protein
MESVCKEWSIKDDKLMNRMKTLKNRYKSVLNAEREVFSRRVIEGDQEGGNLKPQKQEENEEEL